MAQEIWTVIGQSNNLSFEFSVPDTESPDHDVLWLAGQMYVSGNPTWIDDQGRNAPLEWDWRDLLEFLAYGWPWLLLDENYPIEIAPTYPAFARVDAERRWEGLDDELAEHEQREFCKFEARHDLSTAFKGAYISPIWILRQGQTVLLSVEAHRKTQILPFSDVKDILERVGEYLAEHLRNSEAARSLELLNIWNSRWERTEALHLELRSGLPSELRNLLTEGVEPNVYWELTNGDYTQSNELLAAARMTVGRVPVETQRIIIDRLRNCDKIETPELDALEREFHSAFEAYGKPAFQGYWAATWLREKLGHANDDYVDPRDILKSWRVTIDEIDLASDTIDAISAWGPRHGPAILVNKYAESRAGHLHGRRTTFAHEICHLLIDRNYGLPVAEVFGGNTPVLIEQRANAFAAQLLLPREIAYQYFKNRSDVESAVLELVRSFRVSPEVAVWQIVNSRAKDLLTKDESIRLHSMRSAHG